MRPQTYLNIIMTCESRKAVVVNHRGLFGVANDGEWSRLDHISRRAQGRLMAAVAQLQRSVKGLTEELSIALRQGELLGERLRVAQDALIATLGEGVEK